MRHIKHELIVTLIKALHEANLSDVENLYEGHDQQNDLCSSNCNQYSLYGHLSNALDTLGQIAHNGRSVYVETGSADEAIAFVNDYYTARINTDES